MDKFNRQNSCVFCQTASQHDHIQSEATADVLSPRNRVAIPAWSL